MREFNSGATRDTDDTKPDPEGCYHPLVLKAVSDYMAKHSYLPDGTRRAADNWQAGMPRAVWRKSLERHWLDVKLHDKGHGDEAREPIIDALCAVIFNAQGRLLEELLDRDLSEDGDGRKKPSLREINDYEEFRTRQRNESAGGFLEAAYAEIVRDFAQRVDDDIMSLIPDLPRCRCVAVPAKKKRKAKR
jgi:hypothetical protein